MAEVGIRSYLNGKGFKDDEITYNNGNIMLKGKQFYNATPNEKGITMGDQNQLNQAYNSYNMNDALETWKTNMSKPRQQFNYDPNTDQNYQQALQAAQRSAQTAGNNATVALGSRGIGNSQQAITTQNQIGQRAVADVNSNILPQLMNQAYTRFHDQQVMDDQRNDNYLKLADMYNNLGQQDFNNQRLLKSDERQDTQDARQKKLDNVAIQQYYEQQYGVPIEAKEDWSLVADQVKGLKPLLMREYEDKRADTQFDQKYKTDQQNFSQWLDKQQLGVSQANSGQSASNAGFNRLLDIWDRTGQAPAGLESMGIKPGAVLNDKNAIKEAEKAAAEKAEKFEKEKTGLANALNNGDLSYSDAEKSIQTDLAMGFYTSDEAAELNTLLKNWAAAAYGQRNN